MGAAKAILAGAEAGGKLAKACELGIRVLDEASFRELCSPERSPASEMD
jgi:NAD-dependent DNA ligase